MIVKKTHITQWQEKLGRDYHVRNDGCICIDKIVKKRFIIWSWYDYEYMCSFYDVSKGENVDFTQPITVTNREFAEYCDKIGLNVVLEV